MSLKHTYRTLFIIHVCSIYTIQGMKSQDIHVLLWTSKYTEPFSFFSEGRNSFMERNCKFQNCYVTDNRTFKDIRKFNVVLINLLNLPSLKDLPLKRSEDQKYVLVSTRFPGNNFLTSDYNRVFNLTWTFKLDSDITWPYMVIRDSYGNVVGPKTSMHWSAQRGQKYQAVFEAYKTNFAACLVKYCDIKNDRDRYIYELKKALNGYGFVLDIYSTCNKREKNCSFSDDTLKNKDCDEMKCYDCPNNKMMVKCDEVMQSNYHFLLAFEETFAEDFVSRDLLFALQHFSVPVVFGGADYSRFMPENAYINAQGFTPEKLANILVNFLFDSKSYSSISLWRENYIYHAPENSPDTDPICRFCAYLNDNKKTKKRRVYKDIVTWFYGKNKFTNPYRFDSEIQIIDLHNFKFKLNSNVCEPYEYLPLIRVVVSDLKHYNIRKTIRDVWDDDPDDLKVVFLVGETNDASVTKNIIKEHKKYGDIVQGSFMDTYRNLTYKHIMALYWVTHYCSSAKYMLKTDDDVFVNTGVLKRVMSQEIKEQHKIICNVYHKSEVQRDRLSKHYISEKEYADSTYPSYCSGPFVIYNTNVAPLLVMAARNEPYLHVEDVYTTGILREKVKLDLKDISNLLLNHDKISLDEAALKQKDSFLYAYNVKANDMKLMRDTLKWHKTKKRHHVTRNWLDIHLQDLDQ